MAKLAYARKREWVDLFLVLVVSIVFTFISLSINFIDTMYKYFYVITHYPAAELVINLVFLWLIGLLWVTYRQWQRSLQGQMELEDTISSINPDVLMVIDGNQKVILCNAPVRHMFGYEAAEIINKHTDFLFSDREPCPAGEQAMPESPGNGGFQRESATGKRKSGETFGLEIITAKLRNREGAVLLLKDVNERRRAQDAVKLSEERYQRLIENANDGIVSTDNAGIIIGFNKKAEGIFGYAQEEVMGKPVFFLFPEEERDGDMKMFEQFKTTGEPELIFKTIERDGLRKDGRRISLEATLSVSGAKEKSIITTILRDITERRKMEQQLSQSEKLRSLGELAGGVAHEFNNVLAAILGRVQLLKMQLEPPLSPEERQKLLLDLLKSLDIIEKASFDGAQVVKRIQEFSRKRTDNQDFTPITINELLENALEFTHMRWKNDAETKGITIAIDKAYADLPATFGSASEIREVFTNIINNALDAMPDGGRIAIRTFREDDQICVTIEDTGVGIPESIRSRIFDPFFTTKGVQSTGLGMSVAYGIVNRHHGAIAVDSVEGKGSAFTIKLPIVQEKFPEHASVKPEAEKNRKARILVIEDEEDVRQLLFDILSSEGHEVEVASDGIQGLDIFRGSDFDLVCTDLGMPKVSGWQVAEEIKRIGRRVPVAIITGWDVNIMESELKEKAINFVIQKPFQVKQVLGLVKDGILLKEQFKAA
jgi:PAS domain S-box-containing protein